MTTEIKPASVLRIGTFYETEFGRLESHLEVNRELLKTQPEWFVPIILKELDDLAEERLQQTVDGR